MWEITFVIFMAALYIGSQLEKRNDIEQKKLDKEENEENSDIVYDLDK